MDARAGRPAAGPAPLALGLAVGLACAAGPAAAAAPDGAPASPVLEVIDGEGRVRAAEPLGPEGRWCLVWNHSVTGIEVADCFRAEAGRLVLEASHQPDFAAGLGAVPGRGSVRSDGAGGYVIEGIEAAMPEEGLAIRRGGAAVNHRLRLGYAERPLPPGAPGERLLLRLAPPPGP